MASEPGYGEDHEARLVVRAEPQGKPRSYADDRSRTSGYPLPPRLVLEGWPLQVHWAAFGAIIAG